jgi:glutathione synthase/RimK-type ligase-like ATP-grasp enzyme
MWPFVARALTADERHRVVPFFTDLPDRYRCSYEPISGSGTVSSDELTLAMDEISAVWWRRVIPPRIRASHGQLDAYTSSEYDAFLAGLEFVLPNARWLSRPSAIDRARHKPLQLALARRYGFSTVPTVFTNDPEVLRARAAAARSVFKSIRSPRVPATPEQLHTLFTAELDQEALRDADGVQSCPGIVQEFVDKAADIRVTVIGDRWFAVHIDSQARSDTSLDFRRNGRDLAHSIFPLERSLGQSCVRLVHDCGLAFGAIDFALLPSGNLLFFELNPNGQWGWLEEATGLPMRRALVNWLLGIRDV